MNTINDLPENARNGKVSRGAIAPESGADAQSTFRSGLALAVQGRLVEARRYFARAVDKQPNYPEAYYNLALTFHLAGENLKAETFYRHALNLNPHYAEAWCNLGIALHADEKLSDAMDAYRNALAADKHVPRARAYLGAALCNSGQLGAARDTFNEIVAEHPNDPLARFSLGRIAFEKQDFRTATAELSHALDALTTNDECMPNGVISESEIPSYPVQGYPDALRAAVKKLSAHGIEATLICGTLIGAMREKDFFSFDKDIDLGIDGSVTPAQLDAMFGDDPDFSRLSSLGDDEILCSYAFRGTVAIDFFRIFHEPDRTWYGLHWHGEIIKWVHRPFTTRDFFWQGVNVKIPDDADRFLTECYGDWRTPDPFFAAWASPNMEGGFPIIARAIAYGQIFKAAWQGQRKKAHHLCALALALDIENPTLLRLRDLLTEPCPPRRSTPVFAQALGDTFDNLPG
jgi:tetratricopeptide (TPR) repeat protein